MLGVSTWAYTWRRHAEASAQFTIEDVLDDAARLGVGLVQVCDVPDLERADAGWLSSLRAAADGRGLVLETGTRGLEPDHLRRHLATARTLGARLVRSMLSSPRGQPTLEQARDWLGRVLPEFERAGVTLALETYEQVSTADLVELVSAFDSPALGICLDPGNTVARLEHPLETARLAAPWVVNLHVKDFAFTRADATIGFTFAGARLGEGLLDYPGTVALLRAAGRDVNHVVEHWLGREQTVDATAAKEREWVDASVAWLRRSR